MRDNLKMKTTRGSEQVKVFIAPKPGWPLSVATWLEYGTDPHFISVDDSQRQGRSVARINRLAKEPDSNHSLVIGGQFVGTTVFHPGARPEPAFRPALDTKEGEAIAAAQRYIDAKIARSGLAPESTEEGEDV